MLMIKLQNLTKKFGSFTAIDNISLEIPSGQFFGFLGPNGAGKTTTIKMMTGLYNPTHGDVLINSVSIIKSPVEVKKQIGYIPDRPFIYDKLTGREYLYFCGGLFEIENSKLEGKIEDLIKHFEISEWIDKRSENYSQGMSQRLIIAAAILHDPKVIIIDEPMIGLDPRSAAIVKNVLKERSRNGSTVFMSTHILHVAEELCDRIAIINKGKIIFDYSHDELQSFKHKYNGKLENLFLELTE
jgi:ABC-2 type transport system ATP-binding protein